MFASGKVVGPVLYARYKGIHFIGEHHHVNFPEDDADYVLNKITKSVGRVVLLIEASPLDLPTLIASPPTSPLRLLARKLKVLPDNISVVFSNIRCTAPFLALEAIYYFEGFAQMMLSAQSSTFDEEYRALWKAAKRFEKQFVSHVAKTRQGCARFMKALAHPDYEPPVWFVKCLTNMKIGLDNPFKDTMRDLRRQDPVLFERLMGTMGAMFDKKLLENRYFSQGMDKANRIRRTGSVNMVMEKNPFLQAFWVAINSIFMDIFMIYKIFQARASKPDAEIVVLVGKNHVLNILDQFDQNQVQFVYNEKAVLDLDTLQTGPVVTSDKSAQSLMRNFLDGEYPGSGRP